MKGIDYSYIRKETKTVILCVLVFASIMLYYFIQGFAFLEYIQIDFVFFALSALVFIVTAIFYFLKKESGELVWSSAFQMMSWGSAGVSWLICSGFNLNDLSRKSSTTLRLNLLWLLWLLAMFYFAFPLSKVFIKSAEKNARSKVANASIAACVGLLMGRLIIFALESVLKNSSKATFSIVIAIEGSLVFMIFQSLCIFFLKARNSKALEDNSNC